MSLSTPESVQKLQTALHAKAKDSPGFRFYALYDKVYRKDVLAFAYACCKANGGAAGVDHQTFEDIEAYGEERWLDELSQLTVNAAGSAQVLPGTDALNALYDIAADGIGNLWIADGALVWKLATTGTVRTPIQTVAGDGYLHAVGDGGPATSAI